MDAIPGRPVWRPFFRATAAVMASVLALTSAGPALAQGAGAAKPDEAAAAPGHAGKPAKPKKKLTEAQKKAEAKKLFTEAKQKFEAGDFAGALPLFREADELVPGAPPKYYAAVCVDKTGTPVDAIAAYQAYLDSKPDPEKYKDKIAEVTARIEAIKNTPAKVKVVTDPPSPFDLKLMVDGQVQAGPELSVPPGKHTIAATAEGYEETKQEIEVTFGETKEVKLSLTKAEPAPVVAVAPPPPPVEPAPQPEQPPPEKPKPRSNVPAYVTLGLAGAGAVVGTIFGVQALGAKSDFDADPTTENADRAERNALIADMSFAIALTFGVTGTVLLLSNRSKSTDEAPKTASKPVVVPFVGPTGGGAAATLKF